MIFDTIENLNKYQIPQNIIDFVKNIQNDIKLGKHDIDGSSYANVDIYNTKNINDCKLEAHKKFIDIQLLLKGEERIDFINIEELETDIDYDEMRDLVFFKNSTNKTNSVYLKAGNFAIFYPQDAHMPQIETNSSEQVKKVVVKIAI